MFEDKMKQAIVDELKRQAELRPGSLKVQSVDEGRLSVEGEIDLDDLAMVMVGSVAGGP